MKKIINGKKYDTTTAKYLGMYENMEDCAALDYAREELYKKKTGEFFLYINPSVRSGGHSFIDPYTEDKAKQWAEKYLSGDEYEEIFGEAEE